MIGLKCVNEMFRISDPKIFRNKIPSTLWIFIPGYFQEIVFTCCDFEISVVSVELSLEGNVIVIDGMTIFGSFSFESRDRAFCTPAIQLKTPPIQIKSPAMWIVAAKLNG